VTGKILLVEDDLDLMHLFNDALLSGGYQVDGFTEPLKAFSHFKDNPHRYDLVISDVRMPQMSGLELVKKINQVNKDVKVLLMSAFEMEKDSLKELKLNDFLQKPLHIEQLMNTVKKYLDKKSTTK
jgi:DNA-binding NtrC family response regulator